MKTKLNIALWALLMFATVLNAQEGEKLFKANCGVCHSVGKGKVVGPDLKDVHTKYKEDWLTKWIKSSQTLVKKGDPVAVKLFEENNKMIMPDPVISETEIKTIIAFIKETSEKPVEVVSADKPKENTSAAPETKPEAYDYHAKDSNAMSWKTATFVLSGFCILLVIIIIALSNTLGGLVKSAYGAKPNKDQSVL
jgi:cytochrome c551/c552